MSRLQAGDLSRRGAGGAYEGYTGSGGEAAQHAREYQGPTTAPGPRRVWFGSILAEGGIPGDCPDYPQIRYGVCVKWLIVS